MQVLWKPIWMFLKKLKIQLPFDSAIPLLGIYPKEFKSWSWRVICIPIFIAALFTIVEKWKQHKCPSMDEENVVYSYKGLLLSLKKEILPWVTAWMKLEDNYAQWNKPMTKGKYCMIPLIWDIKISQTQRNRK